MKKRKGIFGRKNPFAKETPTERAQEFKDVYAPFVDVINQCIKKTFQIMDTETYITASLGVTIFPDDSSDMDELLKFCDFAIYKSKYKERNICTFFDEQISETY